MNNSMPQINRARYQSIQYDTKERFNSYWYQIHEVMLIEPSSILEIGVGNGFVSQYLRRMGMKITTLDINQDLKPDKVGSILAIPFQDNTFNLIACFEVLEHLPYPEFDKALKELYRVSNKYVVISLPDAERCYKLCIENNNGKGFKKYIEIPKCRGKEHVFVGKHYWEIGKKGYSLAKICEEIKNNGFAIERTYRLFEHAYHRMFILKKRSGDTITSEAVTFRKSRIGNIEDWRKIYYEEDLRLNTIIRYIIKFFTKRK